MDAPVNPPAVRADVGRLGARGETVLACVAAALLLATLFLGWRIWFHAEEGDPVASAMQTFEKQNDLIVLTYRFQEVAESVIEGPMDIALLERRQLVIVPATVDYRVRFADIEASDMAWDKDRQRLTVTLPVLRISRPNLDEGNARGFTGGIWVSREDATKLARKNSQIAESRAVAYAKDAEVLAMARNAARDAVQRNLAVPLRAMGFDDAQVEVRFANAG